MIKRVKPINRTANALYCVTKISKNKDKIHQEQTWHSDKQSAIKEDKGNEKA